MTNRRPEVRKSGSPEIGDLSLRPVAAGRKRPSAPQVAAEQTANPPPTGAAARSAPPRTSGLPDFRTSGPALRIRACNRSPVRSDGTFVLYWMIANRRTSWNHSLDRAVGWARELGRPLLILEALRCGYPWASARLHRFVLQGMADNAVACARAGVAYHAYVEDRPGAGTGLLESLGREACVVVTDEFPCFFLPRMVAAAASRMPVLLEAVDGNGVLPLAAADHAFPTAYAFRRFLQKTLPAHLGAAPRAKPFAGAPLPRLATPPAAFTRWPAAAAALLAGDATALAALPIDHGVAPVALTGGAVAAERQLEGFLDQRLARYGEERSLVANDCASGLSPWLHFGHISAHAVLARVLAREDWSPERLGQRCDGKKEGWWGLSASAESFLDELVTWRELGYVFCQRTPDHDCYESLPPWARATLDQHTADARQHRYSLDDFSAGRTHDPLWNAAQGQLRTTGRMHNYLRMLWGKKILEWTAHPREALAVMIDLNNRYALDGRDPNSYSGIFWCLGRFDRPWAPQRPIFGQIRYMSSANTARKMRVTEYIATYAPAAPGTPDGQQRLFNP